MVASMTTLPVIGVPVPLKYLDGMDSLLSIVQMPAGIPVATMGVGGARNAGLMAVRILAAGEGEEAQRLRQELARFAEDLSAQAHAKGVVDQLVATREELVPAAKAWIREHQDDEGVATKPWDIKGYKIPGGSPSVPKFAANLPAFPANLRKTLKGAPTKSPRAILAAAVELSLIHI